MNSKSCFLDPVPTWLVKLLIPEFAPIFSRFANLSLTSGIFPDSEKRAVVLPLLKKKNLDRNILTNYRPISSLSFLSKFVERVVARRITDFLSMNDLLCPFQSAYRIGHSTETVFTHLLDEIARSKNLRRSSCILFLDLSAAFDSIDPVILLDRLKQRFRLTGSVHKWLSSYLSNRSQIVRLNGFLSQFCPVFTGVPQGSVLGPLLFSLFVSPVSDLIDGYGMSHHLYADDIAIFTSFDLNGYDASLSLLQDCVFHLQDWFNANRLKLNPAKSELIVCPCHLCPTPDIVSLGVINVSASPVVKYLGVSLDSSLSFENHIQRVSRESFAFLRNMWKIRQFVSDPVVLKCVHAFIFSKLDYCNVALSHCPQYRLRPLQRVLNACVRLVKRIPRYNRVSPFLRELGWLPINFRIQFKICCLVHRCLHGPCPTYLSVLLRMSDSSTISTSLRSKGLCSLHQPLATGRFSRSSFSVLGPRLWNALPPSCRCEPSFWKFKKLLRATFFDRL